MTNYGPLFGDSRWQTLLSPLIKDVSLYANKPYQTLACRASSQKFRSCAVFSTLSEISGLLRYEFCRSGEATKLLL